MNFDILTWHATAKTCMHNFNLTNFQIVNANKNWNLDMSFNKTLNLIPIDIRCIQKILTPYFTYSLITNNSWNVSQVLLF